MSCLLDIARSLFLGILIAAVAYVLRVRRARSAWRTWSDAYIGSVREQIARYRALGRTPERRALSDAEREVLNYLLCGSEPGPSPFCPQVFTVHVRARCSCGCPSVDFSEAVSGADLLPIVEMLWRSDDGERHGIVALAAADLLVALQVYTINSKSHPRTLPSVEQLSSGQSVRTSGGRL